MTESERVRPVAARELAAIALAAAALFFPGLGLRDLWNPNEPIYGLAVREMAQRGDWLVPTVNEQVFGEKPILYYWMARVSSAITGGVSEMSLRIPTAIAGVAIVVLVFLLVAPYAGRRRAGLAALIAATTFGIFWNARFVQMDILIAATSLATIVPAVFAIDGRLRAGKGWALAGVGAGLGFLAKGPVGWICPGIAIALYAIATGRKRALFHHSVLAAAAIAIVVAAPWYVALAATGHDDVLHEVLIRQNFSRFVQAWDHAEPWWYYIKYLWIDGAPWSWLLPLVVAMPGRDIDETKLDRLCWSWLIGIVVFFSLSDSKRSPYILPAIPAVAILASGVLERAMSGRLTAARSRVLAVLGVASGTFLLAGGGWLVLKGADRAAQIAGPLRATGAITAASGLAILLALLTMRRIALFVAIGAFAAVFLAASILAAPAANVFKSARGFGHDVGKVAGSDAVVSYGLWKWRSEYVYYVGRPIRNMESLDEVRATCSGSQRSFVLVEEGHVDEIRRLLGREPVLRRAIGGGEAFLFRCGD